MPGGFAEKHSATCSLPAELDPASPSRIWLGLQFNGNRKASCRPALASALAARAAVMPATEPRLQPLFARGSTLSTFGRARTWCCPSCSCCPAAARMLISHHASG